MSRSVYTLVVLAILALCLLPCASITIQAFSRGDSGQAVPWLPAGERELNLLIRSIYIAGLATLFSLLIGIPAGLALARSRGPLLELLCVTPIILPSITIVMGWIFVFGHNGALKSILGMDKPLFNLYTPVGAAAVLAACYFPCVSLLAAEGFRCVHRSWMNQAALVNERAALKGIIAPIVAPYAATGAALVFAISLGDYGVPSALMINVYPVEIFTQLGAYNDTRAALMASIPPLIAVAAVIALRQAFFRPKTAIQTSIYSAAGFMEGSRAASAVRILGAALITLAILPPAAGLLNTSGGAASYKTALVTAGDQLIASMLVALYSAMLMLAVSIVYAVCMRGRPAGFKSAGETALLFSICVPGSLIGLGLLGLRNGGVWPFEWLSRGPLIIAYACCSKYMIIPAVILGAQISSVRPSVMNSAALASESRLRRFSKITLPLIRTGLVSAFIAGFVFSLGELSASLLIYPPGWMTLPVRIESLLHFGEDATVASLCIVLAAVVISSLTLVISIFNLRLTRPAGVGPRT